MKTNIGLVEHAKMLLNMKAGYIWGGFGQVLTPALLQQKVKQYPNQVGQHQTFIKQNWLNKRVVDCVGLIKSYLWWNCGSIKYNASQDLNANVMHSRAKEKGVISTIPEIPGLCVWKQGHIGVYIGKGQVIEARNTTRGVIQSPLKGIGSIAWTHWSKCPFIEYVKEVKPVDKKHWAEVHYDNLKKKGIEVHEQRFDDNITRGEVFAILDRITDKMAVK